MRRFFERFFSAHDWCPGCRTPFRSYIGEPIFYFYNKFICSPKWPGKIYRDWHVNRCVKKNGFYLDRENGIQRDHTESPDRKEILAEIERNRPVKYKPKVGEWYWFLEAKDSFGNMRRDDFTLPLDFTIIYGEVVYVGKRVIVFRNKDYSDSLTLEWVCDNKEYGLLFKTGDDLANFIRNNWKCDWVNKYEEGFGFLLEKYKYKFTYWVGCHNHGPFDPEEMCFTCAKDLSKLEQNKEED